MGKFCTILITAFWFASASFSQDRVSVLMQTAQQAYAAAMAQPVAERLDEFATIRNVFDSILAEAPNSPQAVAITLQLPVDGIDVARVNAALDAAPTIQLLPDSMNNQDATATLQLLPNQPASSAPLQLLPDVPPRPEKDIIRDVQAGLNDLGCGAGSADGVAGSRTKRAFAHFIAMTGSKLTEDDLATEEAVQAIRSIAEPVCTAQWAFAYNPDAASGNWGFRSECQLLLRKLKVTGTINIGVEGDRFSGRIRNSLNQSGRVNGRVSGRNVYATMTYPQGTVTATLWMSSKSLTLTGEDSNGCSVVAWKS